MLRYIKAIFIALAVTAGLFFMMQMLIDSGDLELEEERERKRLDFVEIKQDETVEKKERKPKKPPPPEEPPPDLDQPQLEQSDLSDTASAISFSADVGNAGELGGGMQLNASDGEYLPIVKVAPNYPRLALSRGIEGWVLVEFTVTPQGSVSDPFVVEAEPEGIFNRAALEAASKFKYKPRVVDGKAISVPGVQNRITFKMK